MDRQNAYLEHYSKNAMACEFAFLFNMQQYSQSGQAAHLAFQLIDRLEDQLSIYREDSEISNLNRRWSSQPVAVEQYLFELLLLAERIFQETGGAFDITSTPLSRIWGFHERQGRVPDQADIDEALELVGSQKLKLDSSSLTVSSTDAKVTINLGGIGKGHASIEWPN